MYGDDEQRLRDAFDHLSVEANLTEERIVTGWMENKGLIQPNTPDGDKILFGEAVDAEDQAPSSIAQI